MKATPRFWLASMIAVVCLAVLYIFVSSPFVTAVQNTETAADAERSYSLWLFVTNRVHFDGRSVMEPDKPPVYSSPRHNSAALFVYGVTNAERQEEVLTAVREWQATNPSVAKIGVRFYQRETWRLFANDQAGVSGESRWGETLLREVFVK